MSQEYDEHEWTTLLFAPLWVFEAVARADGQVSDEEWQALFQALRAARRHGNNLTRDVLQELADDLDEVMSIFREDEAEAEDGLSEVADLLAEREPDTVAGGFKAELVTLAVQVAKASGGWLSSGISDGEQQAIGLISASLDMDEEAFYSILRELEAL
jgi:hypothetical protein